MPKKNAFEPADIELEEKSVIEKPKKKKKTSRAPSAYNDFVSENFNNKSLAGLSAKERMTSIALLWNAKKNEITARAGKKKIVKEVEKPVGKKK
jgi:hypothetical protein